MQLTRPSLFFQSRALQPRFGAPTAPVIEPDTKPAPAPTEPGTQPTQPTRPMAPPAIPTPDRSNPEPNTCPKPDPAKEPATCFA